MNNYLRLLLLVTAVLIGFLVGYLPSRHNLNRCRQSNAVLADDLGRAMARGITVEAELILCREGRRQ